MPSFTHCFSNFNVLQNHLEGLLKDRLLGITPRVFNFIGLGWDQRMCISNKFPLMLKLILLVQRTHFEGHCAYMFSHFSFIVSGISLPTSNVIWLFKKEQNKLPIHATILSNFKNVMLLKKKDVKGRHSMVQFISIVQEQAKLIQDDLNPNSGYPWRCKKNNCKEHGGMFWSDVNVLILVWVIGTWNAFVRTQPIINQRYVIFNTYKLYLDE